MFEVLLSSMFLMFMIYNKMLIYNLMFIYFLILMFYYIDFDYYYMNFIFGSDLVSNFMVMLSFWIIGIILMLFKEKEMMNKILFIILIIIMEVSFLSLNFLVFYMFFELSLIPMFLIIMINSSSIKRFKASMYMFMYTMFFSLPLLVELILSYSGSMTVDMNYMDFLLKELNSIDFILMILAFMVKVPIYLLHYWLLKAHVEAPVYGSMMLAGILLKLGSYGVLRLMWLYSYSFSNFSVIFISLMLMGSLKISWITIFQEDMKIIIAYSSIVHMSMMISGIFSMSELGIYSAIFMMISHGLCSSGLFYMVNLIYEKTGSRMKLINKGLINYSFIFSMWWFLLCSCNMAVPISLNLVSEIMLFCSLISWGGLMISWMLIMIIFFSSYYSIVLFLSIFGFSMNMNKLELNLNMKENLILILHWVPLNLMTLGLSLMML